MVERSEMYLQVLLNVVQNIKPDTALREITRINPSVNRVERWDSTYLSISSCPAIGASGLLDGAGSHSEEEGENSDERLDLHCVRNDLESSGKSRDSE